MKFYILLALAAAFTANVYAMDPAQAIMDGMINNAHAVNPLINPLEARLLIDSIVYSQDLNNAQKIAVLTALQNIFPPFNGLMGLQNYFQNHLAGEIERIQELPAGAVLHGIPQPLAFDAQIEDNEEEPLAPLILQPLILAPPAIHDNDSDSDEDMN